MHGPQGLKLRTAVIVVILSVRAARQRCLQSGDYDAASHMSNCHIAWQACIYDMATYQGGRCVADGVVPITLAGMQQPRIRANVKWFSNRRKGKARRRAS